MRLSSKIKANYRNDRRWNHAWSTTGNWRTNLLFHLQRIKLMMLKLLQWSQRQIAWQMWGIWWNDHGLRWTEKCNSSRASYEWNTMLQWSLLQCVMEPRLAKIFQSWRICAFFYTRIVETKSITVYWQSHTLRIEDAHRHLCGSPIVFIRQGFPGYCRNQDGTVNIKMTSVSRLSWTINSTKHVMPVNGIRPADSELKHY